MNAKITLRNLPVPLTDIEKLERGAELAQLHHDMRYLEVKKKSAMDTFKADIESLNSRIGYAALIIRRGEENRNVECAWRYSFEMNTKELIRMDTGEIVETAAITAEERQLMLQIDTEHETGRAAENAR